MQIAKRLSIIVFLVILMAACGGSPKTKILGKWKFVTLDGKPLSEKDKVESWEFKKDGIVEMVDSKKTQNASWEFDKAGKTLTLKKGGRQLIFTEFSFKDKNQISFTMNGKSAVMQKQ
jgi:hypothetical protein